MQSMLTWGQLPAAGLTKALEAARILQQKETMFTLFSPSHTSKGRTLQVGTFTTAQQ